VIEKRATASGEPRYEVRLRGPDGKERSRTFRTHTEARKHQAAEIARMNRGEWIDQRLARTPFGEVAELWARSNPGKRPSAVARDEVTMRKHLAPTLGGVPISAIKPSDIQSLVNEWARVRAPRTVKRDYGVLRAILNFAVENDYIARTPCRGIKLPQPTDQARHVVTADELAALADAMGEQGPMACVGAVLGLRWGEVAGLRVGQVDFLRSTVTISEQVTRGPKGESVLGPPKSEAGRRTLTMPAVLKEMLSAHLAVRGLTGADADEFVFAAPEGGHWSYSNWRHRVWVPAVVAAGLGRWVERADKKQPKKKVKAFEGLGFHDLRRANASGLVADGVDIKTAGTRLGHSDPRLTLAVYAQAMREPDVKAAEAMGSRFMPTREAADQEVARGMDAGSPDARNAEAAPERAADLHVVWSGWRDLNPRPLRPERSALPS
jgi:integrase